MTELSVESAEKVDVKQMTKAERRELRRILKRRFHMLRQQLNRRESELARALEKQVRDEKAGKISKIEKKLKPLYERNNKLAEAIYEVHQEAHSLGVRIAIAVPHTTDLEVFRARHGRPAVEADAHDEVRERIQEIKEEAGWGKLNLSELEWRLDEQLAVGELESNTSKEFLDSLPTVESLLPLPKGLELPEIGPPESI